LADPNIFSNAIEAGERLKIDAATERLVRGVERYWVLAEQAARTAGTSRPALY